MPAIVIYIASRGHKTWQTQCVHRLCVEIGPSLPQTHFQMRRCCADLMFCSGGVFFDKSIKYFTKSNVFSQNLLNPCQPSWFAVVCEATKRQKLNVCTDFVLNLTHPRPKHFLKWGAAVRIWLFAQDADFSQNRCSFLKIWCFSWTIAKSMPAIVIRSGVRSH